MTTYHQAIGSLLLSLALVACGGDRAVEPQPAGASAEELIGSSYGVVVKDQEGDLLLFGNLHFSDLDGEVLRGGWRFETWGVQPLFTGLPVNDATTFSQTSDMGDFEAGVFGDLVILPVEFPGNVTTLGIVLEETSADRLEGTVSLLQGGTFAGHLEGIRMK